MAAERAAAASGSASSSGSMASEFNKYNFAFSSVKHDVDAAEWLAIAKRVPRAEWVALNKQQDGRTVTDNKRAYFLLDARSGHQKDLAQSDPSLHTRIAEARSKTDGALRRQLQSCGVDVDQLHTAVLKLLYTNRGAQAQVVHFDVQTKGDESYGVLLYLNGPTTSTFVPTKTAEEMKLLWWKDHVATPDEEKFAAHVRDRQSEYFRSHQVDAGDALFFRTDVAHFGPAQDDDPSLKSRLVLYALFSPNSSLAQDDIQVLPLAHPQNK